MRGSDIHVGGDSARFRRTLSRWGALNRRSFPWRETDDPFRILVAEVLLQRSRGVTVAKVFERLFSRWPDAEHLARARVDSIESVIRPLGLVSRATKLRALGEVRRSTRYGSQLARGSPRAPRSWPVCGRRHDGGRVRGALRCRRWGYRSRLPPLLRAFDRSSCGERQGTVVARDGCHAEALGQGMELGRARPGRDHLPAEDSPLFRLPASSGVRLEGPGCLNFEPVLASPIGSHPC